MDCSPTGSSVHGIFPGKNMGVDWHFFLQGIFLTQRWNSHLLWLLNWQADSLPLSQQGNPLCVSVNQWVQSLSHVLLFATPWTAARQASLWPTPEVHSNSSIKSVMPSSHLILCHLLLLLPPIPPSIRVFSNESTLCMRWPKYWSFSFSISPSNDTQNWSLLGWTGWISLQPKGLSRVFSNTTVQKHQFFGTQLSSQSNSYIHT